MRASATTGSHGSVTGYCLALFANRSWSIGGLDGSTKGLPRPVKLGRYEGASATGWHRMCLNVSAGSTVVGSIEGGGERQVLGPVDLGPAFPSGSKSNFARGMAALGGGWHAAYFDNLDLSGEQ